MSSWMFGLLQLQSMPQLRLQLLQKQRHLHFMPSPMHCLQLNHLMLHLPIGLLYKQRNMSFMQRLSHLQYINKLPIMRNELLPLHCSHMSFMLKSFLSMLDMQLNHLLLLSNCFYYQFHQQLLSLQR